MKQFIAILFLSSILLSCKKSSDEDEYYTISGMVLDFDSNVPIAGARVYVKEYGYMGVVVDSTVSDKNGRYSFNLKKEGKYKYTFPAKSTYLNPINWIGVYSDYNDRTANLYLARPSFVNVTTHKAGVYLSTDTVDVQVLFDYFNGGQVGNYRSLYRDKADVSDKTFNLQVVYGHAMGDRFFGTRKLYFRSDIIRNGLVFSTKDDSTNVIQFGTQNFTLNY